MTQTITKKVRQSNFELLRIVAMILVLLVHVNYFSFGAPTRADIASQPGLEFLRVLGEYACIVCVNVFVLISGWFGIHPKARRFSEFVFQIFFFSITVYTFCKLTSQLPPPVDYVLN